MHGLIFETSIWLLAGSTRYLSNYGAISAVSRRPAKSCPTAPFQYKHTVKWENRLRSTFTSTCQQTSSSCPWSNSVQFRATLLTRIAKPTHPIQCDCIRTNERVRSTVEYWIVDCAPHECVERLFTAPSSRKFQIYHHLRVLLYNLVNFWDKHLILLYVLDNLIANLL